MIYNEILIMSSDDDCPIMMNITIGETILKEIALCLYEEYNGDDDYFSIDKNNLTKVIAVIDAYELPQMAKQIGISPDKVREHLIEKFEDCSYISRTQYVREAFHEMLDYILDNGGKYHIKQ